MGVFEIVSLYCGQVFIEIHGIEVLRIENTESRKKKHLRIQSD